MTTSATIYAWLFIHIGVVIVATAYFTVGALLVPRLTGRARERFAKRPWLPMLVGVATSVPWVVVALFLLNLPNAVFKFIGAFALGAWVLCGLVGGAAIAQQLGHGDEIAAPRWSGTFRGGLFLTLTWALPVVGWLFALPLTLATGLGCLLLGLAPGRKDSALAPPIAVEAPIVAGA